MKTKINIGLVLFFLIFLVGSIIPLNGVLADTTSFSSVTTDQEERLNQVGSPSSIASGERIELGTLMSELVEGQFTSGDASFSALAIDTNTLYVDPVSNNVGIGSATPAQTLDVGTGTVTAGDASFTALAVDTNSLYVDPVSNNVGIGSATPTQTLDLTSSGTITAGDASFSAVTATDVTFGTVQGSDVCWSAAGQFCICGFCA